MTAQSKSAQNVAGNLKPCATTSGPINCADASIICGHYKTEEKKRRRQQMWFHIFVSYLCSVQKDLRPVQIIPTVLLPAEERL
jgi:hypothetical protein